MDVPIVGVIFDVTGFDLSGRLDRRCCIRLLGDSIVELQIRDLCVDVFPSLLWGLSIFAVRSIHLQDGVNSLFRRLGCLANSVLSYWSNVGQFDCLWTMLAWWGLSLMSLLVCKWRANQVLRCSWRRRMLKAWWLFWFAVEKDDCSWVVKWNDLEVPLPFHIMMRMILAPNLNAEIVLFRIKVVFVQICWSEPFRVSAFDLSWAAPFLTQQELECGRYIYIFIYIYSRWQLYALSLLFDSHETRLRLYRYMEDILTHVECFQSHLCLCRLFRESGNVVTFSCRYGGVSITPCGETSWYLVKNIWWEELRLFSLFLRTMRLEQPASWLCVLLIRLKLIPVLMWRQMVVVPVWEQHHVDGLLFWYIHFGVRSRRWLIDLLFLLVRHCHRLWHP